MDSPPIAAGSARRKKPSSPERPLRRKALILALFLIVASSILNAFFGNRGIIELLKARAELRAVEQEIIALRAENQLLLEEIRSLKTDPLAIEKLAREELGLIKPGEIVLVIRKPPTP